MSSRVYFILVILLFLFIPVTVYATSTKSVVIYVVQSGCPSCPVQKHLPRYFSELENSINELGIKDVQVMHLTRVELAKLYERLSVPASMQGSMVVSIDEKFLFINNVPVKIITDFLANHVEDYERIVVFRDKQRGIYRVMDEEGRIIECDMEISVTDCLGEPGSLPSFPPWSFLSLVVVSGLLDSINPCAFAVLLFLVSLLFAIKGQNKQRILLFGLSYILAVYITYLMIGVTLRQVITIIPFHHLASKAGALVVIAAGIIHLKSYFWPDKGISLRLSLPRWRTLRRWMDKGTFPAIFICGILVALYEFPCTGGIYVAILGMLAVRATYIQGIIYLLLYNLAFIVPLIAVLIFASNKKIGRFSLTKWQHREEKDMRLLDGLIYVGLGCLLLILRFA